MFEKLSSVFAVGFWIGIRFDPFFCLTITARDAYGAFSFIDNSSSELFCVCVCVFF